MNKNEVMEQNRVQDELYALHRMITQDVGSSGERILKDKSYLKGKVELYDALIEKYSNQPLNPHEKAALVTMRVERKTYHQAATRNRFVTGLRTGAATGLGTIGRISGGLGRFMEGYLGRGLDNAVARAPFLLRLPLYLATLVPVITGKLLQGGGSVMDFAADLLSEKPRQLPGQQHSPVNQQDTGTQQAAAQQAQRTGQQQQQSPGFYQRSNRPRTFLPKRPSRGKGFRI